MKRYVQVDLPLHKGNNTLFVDVTRVVMMMIMTTTTMTLHARATLAAAMTVASAPRHAALSTIVKVSVTTAADQSAAA